jgi:RNA polymerase sigma factor (sigma-70 family)
VEISPEALDYLAKSDGRMEYADCDRKHERVVRGKKTRETAETLPPLECSYDALTDAGMLFADKSAVRPEDAYIAAEEIRRVMGALTESERELVRLRADGLTERECADMLGTTQQNINRQMKKIRAKAIAASE